MTVSLLFKWEEKVVEGGLIIKHIVTKVCRMKITLDKLNKSWLMTSQFSHNF